MKFNIEDIQNMLAFINRAQMTGAEAEVAVALKQKLVAMAEELRVPEAATE